MNINDVQNYLQKLAEILKVAKNGQLAEELEQFANGLDPFANSSIADFLEFLRQAEEYQRTGTITIQPVKVKQRKPIDEVKVQKSYESIESIYERAALPETTHSMIEKEINEIEQALSREESAMVASRFGIEAKLKTKPTIWQAIRQKISEKKSISERSQVGAPPTEPKPE